jgi:hypothetical protein
MSRETPTAKALHEDWHKRQRATVRALAEGRHTIGAVGGAVVLPDEEKQMSDLARGIFEGQAQERRRWAGSFGYPTPEAVWVAVNKSRADERTQALQDAVDTIRGACEPCGGTGNAKGYPNPEYDECEYCGRPIAAVKALMEPK